MDLRRYSYSAITTLGIPLLLGTIFACSVINVSAKQASPPPAGSTQTQDAHLDFPEGKGKDTTLRICSKCHSPSNIVAAGRDRQAWEDTIIKMTGYGAPGTDDELTEILDYLSVNFPDTGKINVNKAIATQLVKALGLTADEAKEVVDYRTKNGPFKTLDDLKKVPNVDAKKLDLKKGALIF